MDPHSENRLVTVSFDTPEGESPPQTPRRLRPAPIQRESSAVIAHKIEVEDSERKFAHETTWKSCCVTVDRRAVSFFSQLILSVAVVAFCIIMLATNQNCETFSRWSPLLLLIVGIWVPAPRMTRE